MTPMESCSEFESRSIGPEPLSSSTAGPEPVWSTVISVPARVAGPELKERWMFRIAIPDPPGDARADDLPDAGRLRPSHLHGPAGTHRRGGGIRPVRRPCRVHP